MNNLNRSQVHEALKVQKERIPPEKWTAKVRHAVVGGCILAFTFYGAAKWGFPWPVTLGLGAVAGHIISGDFRRALKDLGIATVKDAVESVRRRGSE